MYEWIRATKFEIGTAFRVLSAGEYKNTSGGRSVCRLCFLEESVSCDTTNEKVRNQVYA